jgi:2-dehydropantoate 2-reductase
MLPIATDTLPSLKIAVMGAGAVGCYYGGMLARAGHDVTLIGRVAHVTAIQRNGLHWQTQTLDEYIKLSASTQASAVAGAQLVLCCVKSPDTESAGAAMQPYLAADALVLSLQNGVDNAQRLRHVIAQPVAATVVYVAAEMAGPGYVQHHGRGELVLEPVGASHGHDIAGTLIAAGIPTEISHNVRGALWAKLIINCAYNALSAIMHLPYGRLVAHAQMRAVIDDVVAECMAVARAGGVALADDIEGAVKRIAHTMPAQYSSTAQDLMRGRRTEIDYLNGLIVRCGETAGIAVPMNRMLYALVKVLEEKR